MIKNCTSKQLKEIKPKRRKTAKSKLSSACRKKSNESKSKKEEKLIEFQLNSSLKPLPKKSPIGKACTSPKSLSKTKKKILLQYLPSNPVITDADKSTKRIDARAQSNLEHSLKNRLELSQKVKLHNTSNLCRVQQIIKSSLKKAKKQKSCKEKEMKQKLMMVEIKKLEQDQQNNIIRHVNLHKFKKKRFIPVAEWTFGRKKDKTEEIKEKNEKKRAESTKRPVREVIRLQKNLRSSSVGKEYFAEDIERLEDCDRENNFKGKVVTYRENIDVRDFEESGRREKKSGRIKVNRNISLIDTDDLGVNFHERGKEEEIGDVQEISFESLISNDCILNEIIEKDDDDAEELNLNKKPGYYKIERNRVEQFVSSSAEGSSDEIDNQLIDAAVTRYNEEELIDFMRNRAAKIIQRTYRQYISNKASLEGKKLQNIIKDQIGWREAQLLSLEYLKDKEIEDLNSLSTALGNPQLTDSVMRTITQRYEQFTKLFKENLESIESSMIEKMDTNELLDFSNAIKDKKDAINKLIKDTDLNNSLSKKDLSSILREVNSETQVEPKSKATLKTESIQTSIFSDINEDYFSFHSQSSSESSEVEKIISSKPGPKKPQILKKVKDIKLKAVSLDEVMHIDPELFPEMSNKKVHHKSTKKSINDCTESPLPARPSAPIMFMDTEDSNISLDSLLYNSIHGNKSTLPLLNLNSLPKSAAPLTSDPRIETNSAFISHFVVKTLESLDKPYLRSKLSECIIRDPVKALSQIYELDIDNSLYPEKCPMLLNIPVIIEQMFEDYAYEDILTTQRFVYQADKIHKIMILSVIDEILQRSRPYGVKGKPMPWMDSDRLLAPVVVDLTKVFRTVVEEIEDIMNCQIGKIAKDELVLSNGHVDEELLQEIREESLAYALRKDIFEDDWMWTDYEIHETQTKLDLADMIVDFLAFEIIQLDL